MTKKYKNKYRTESHRMPNWDYSGNGIYFLTIVTQNRVCNLGRIVETHDCAFIELSNFGKIVETEFIKSFEIRNELILDEYVIMPNHLHVIVVLDKPAIVETHGRASLQLREQSTNSFFRKPKSISSFMAGFKSAVNSKIDNYIDVHKLDIPKYNRNNHFFQSNYHDHIIRNNAEYDRIKKYIRNNPNNWDDDKFSTEKTQ